VFVDHLSEVPATPAEDGRAAGGLGDSIAGNSKTTLHLLRVSPATKDTGDLHCLGRETVAVARRPWMGCCISFQ
jgi:hypothetical protein